MKRRSKVLLALGVVFLVLAWRAWPMIGIFSESNLEASANFRLIEAVTPPRTGAVVSYSGFSHPGFEAGRLSLEILLMPRKILHGHAFSHTSTGSHKVTKIAALLANPSSFRDWTGNKGCGGFHADHYFQWTEGTQTWEILLCMGCHEVLMFHAGKALRCDLTRETAKAIKAIESES